MSPSDIQHFLLIYNIAEAQAEVIPYGKDYARALEAYGEVEASHRGDENYEVVLFGSDSVETLMRTHSSFFELSTNHLDRMVERQLAELAQS